jgi:hypothetical protein
MPAVALNKVSADFVFSKYGATVGPNLTADCEMGSMLGVFVQQALVGLIQYTPLSLRRPQSPNQR